MNAWAFDTSLLGAPLAAALLIVATHVVLGREVLQRGIVFIDLTLAQVAALGALAAELLLRGHSPWMTPLAAVTAALLAAALLAWTETHFRAQQEALIGGFYVLAASIAMLLLAQHPQGAEAFTRLLAGQVLWVNASQLWPVALLYAVLLALWFGLRRHRRALFYPLLALAITASVPLAGVYLVFATLVLPALATLFLPETRALAWAAGIGAAACALGLWLSVPLDLPAGPLMVCLLAVLALVAAVWLRNYRQPPPDAR